MGLKAVSFLTRILIKLPMIPWYTTTTYRGDGPWIEWIWSKEGRGKYGGRKDERKKGQKDKKKGGSGGREMGREGGCFGLVKAGKLRGTWHKGRNSAVQSSQLSGKETVQKVCTVQISSLLQFTVYGT